MQKSEGEVTVVYKAVPHAETRIRTAYGVMGEIALRIIQKRPTHAG